MKKLKLYFIFYKNKFAFPLAISLFALYSSKIIPLTILTLVFSTLLIWFYQRFINDKKKQSLYFYYNLGLTETKLYSFTFLVNLFLLICINIITK